MDCNYWNQYSAKIAYEETRKQFFNKYLYRMTLAAKGARYINRSNGIAISDYVATRNMWSSSASYYHYSSTFIEPDNDFLEHLRDRMKLYAALKYRADSNMLAVYTHTEDELKLFHGSMLPKYKDSVITLSGPSNAIATTLLRQGTILTKTDLTFKYKVKLVDGKYGITVKRQILGYLDSLGDLVKVSKAVRGQLLADYSFLWGGWFYTNDLSIVTFLTLIAPKVIGATHEVTKI